MVTGGPSPADSAASTGRSAQEVARLRQTLEDYMQQQGLRSTEQRRLIVESFLLCRIHVSIEELLATVKQRDPGIGYATVYRTLRLLAASGVATEHQFGDGLTRYEVADQRGHHDHLICLGCGQIIEFEEARIEELQRLIAERHHFELRAHKLELYGHCQVCSAAKPED
jgi:Fur family ferric uptake transcriptional regulator